LILNKKAIIEDWVPLFISLIVMIIVILLFMAVKTEDKIEQIYSQEKDEVEAYQILNNYLRLHSDLIFLRLNDVSYENELKEKTRDYFNEILKKKWRLKINSIYNYEPEEIESLVNYEFIKTELPYFDKNVEVIFYYG